MKKKQFTENSVSPSAYIFSHSLAFSFAPLFHTFHNKKKDKDQIIFLYVRVVIYEALCSDVAQGQMNGAPICKSNCLFVLSIQHIFLTPILNSTYKDFYYNPHSENKI